MKSATALAALIFLLCVIQSADARREVMTAEQKQKLEQADRVLVEIIAITEQGQTNPGPLTDTVVSRMQEMGYRVVTDANQPHDVVLRVKCEQMKVWEGTTRSGGDADLPDSPSRVWKGPACQLIYLLDGKKMGWHKEVRTDFQDAREAAAAAKVDDAGQFVLHKLDERLKDYHFPTLLASEWGQESRLLTRLDEPSVPVALKVKIIRQLGEMFATEAVPRLTQGLKDPDPSIAKAAAVALGNVGKKESTAVLLDVLKHGSPELQAAAAKGLGQLGAMHGDFSIIPPLLEALKSDHVIVKTEAAWALGKLPDRRSYEPIYSLYRTLQTAPAGTTDGEQMRKLKEAVNWSLKQIDLFDQFN